MAESRLESPSSVCVDDATLGAFVDGALDPVARERVVAHLASCADCSELVAEVIRADEELSESSISVGPAPLDRSVAVSSKPLFWKRRQRFAAIGGLGALAATVLLFVLNRGTPLDPLVDIVGNERLTAARPTGGFRYGPLRSPLRGPSQTDNLELRAEAARLRERAAQTSATQDLHASGVAQMLAGELDASVGTLEAAAQSRPDDPALRADLGAAFMTRFLARGAQTDATAALEAFDKAAAMSPSLKEVSFNRALLLEALDRPGEALAAWDKYLKLSDTPGWREEAVRRRGEVERRVKGG